eukprot:TRINITY_DN114_c0_g1_i1.p1 TRINITY_DN114_c0_g1~~TRINITY_DN114_c0_g1_i1.p1  ORF type:complete len:276 (+),score=67.89 TRINITY_DN114_c0_g1_i1:329-1156(+)
MRISSLASLQQLTYHSQPPGSWGSFKRSCREEYAKATNLVEQRHVLAGGAVSIPKTVSMSSFKIFHHSSSDSAIPVEDCVRPLPAASAIDFLTLCRFLKTTKRKGWVIRGIQNAESIADHMYRMALMAVIVNEVPGVNRERCVKMALIHDIAEALVGDITPSDGISKEEKSRKERKALDEICSLLGEGDKADEIKDIWNDYENNASLEAKLVKDFDKVELILQALEYENEYGKALDEFFESTTGKFQTDVGRAWAAEVLARRSDKLHDLKAQERS